MLRVHLSSGLAWFFVALAAVPAAGAEIAPGVDYAVYTLSGPKVVYVVSMELARAEYKLEVGWPQHKRNFTSRAPVTTIASLYDDEPDHDVIAAVNGSFFAATPVIVGPAGSRGEMLEEPSTQFDTFFFGPSRIPAMRSRILHRAGELTFANDHSISLLHYNRPDPQIHQVTAYTPQWDSSTRTSFSDPSIAVEVILEDVTYPMRGEKEVSGIVTALRTGSSAQNNAIPAGGMVLSAWGNSRTEILNNTQVGDRLRMLFGSGAPEYNNADMCISGAGWLLDDGTSNPNNNWSGYDSSFVYNRNPRTALAWNDTHLFMMVVDGRQTYSIGMTFPEMVDFLANTLGATDGLNLDGGGSSTMVVDDVLRNSPSDGSQRWVANAVLLVKEDTSTSFPVIDLFTSAGRLAGWDDKFTYSPVKAFAPTSPGGDGYVMQVYDPDGGVDTVRRGDYGDTDYTVEADVYCAYRPEDAGDGYERYGLFARDSGTGAFGLSTYGGGNCYALTFDSDDGRVRAGKYVNGVLTDFLAATPEYRPSTAWRRLRIDCDGTSIRYWVDGELLADVVDTSFSRGYFGVGYHEFFGSNGNIEGTRVDNLLAYVAGNSLVKGDFEPDGDVDQADFGRLQACITGTGLPQLDPACLGARLDGDSDVDDDDRALLLGCMSGPNVPASQLCGE